MISASEQRLSGSPQKLTNEPRGPTRQQLRPGMARIRVTSWGWSSPANANSGDTKGGGGEAWSPQGEGGQQEAPVVAHSYRFVFG